MVFNGVTNALLSQPTGCRSPKYNIKDMVIVRFKVSLIQNYFK